MERIVKPEILDSLEASDAAAIRSRKDLRLINWFMRGESWILEKLGEFENPKKIVEIGAGEGILAAKIKAKFPSSEVIAIDLQSKPETADSSITWLTDDVLNSNCYDSDTIVVANLFIHHLTDDQLWDLGEKIADCRGLIVSEPHRYWFSKLIGYPLFPVVNYVTRHDMIVSIEAGFRFGEIPGLLDVNWHWDERSSLGGIRSIGRRTSDE